MQIGFPFRIDGRGRTAEANANDHISQMIEQFLFTNPGERVNRPDFGSGLLQLLFAPNSPELEATLQFTTQAGLQQWLGDVIDVQMLRVSTEDSTLHVFIEYVVRSTGESQSAEFSRRL
jgi:hypothetical protein